ncbi:MAG: FAD-dependent thymidylate synthase [Nitrospirota bacterium]
MTRAEKLPRPRVPSLDRILGVSFKILDDGFVRVIDYMGSDEAIVQAARVSYGKGTKKINEDRGLIRYLMRHHHSTPFEMCEIKLHVRVPMDCWRQWIRHRTANVNEYSTRYSLAIDSAQKTKPADWRKQSVGNRQGSEDVVDREMGAKLTQRESDFQKASRDLYENRLTVGVAREQARKDLPLSTYTEAYWKIDLHNLLHFLALRMEAHAQFEIRSYANIIGNEIVKKWCPLTWESFLDYRMNAMSLSAIEAEIIAKVAAGETKKAYQLAVQLGLISKEDPEKKNRERDELTEKLIRFNLPVPWAPTSASD